VISKNESISEKMKNTSVNLSLPSLSRSSSRLITPHRLTIVGKSSTKKDRFNYEIKLS